MESRNLGRSGLKVSALGLGTMSLGVAAPTSRMHGLGCDEATAHSILDRAVEAGVSLIDTADVYGQEGHSERILGDWLARSRRRHEVVLATKFGFRMAPGPNGSGASRLRVMQAVEASLRRLGTDHIDLYQVHVQDLETAEEETLRALDDCVRTGKVRYIGCSNYTAYRLAHATWLGRVNGWTSYVSLQAQYSLVARDIEREHVPLCRAHGLGLLPWSPLAGGFLSGKYSRQEGALPGTRLHRFQDGFPYHHSERSWRVLEVVGAIARERQTTTTAVALAWCLGRPAVSSVLFGARSLRQLNDNLAAAALVLSPEERERLDATSGMDAA